jgi:hypothetical protein
VASGVGRGKKRCPHDIGRGDDSEARHNTIAKDGNRSAPADGRWTLSPSADVDDGRVVGIVLRFDFSGMELDRLDEETGLWERI